MLRLVGRYVFLCAAFLSLSAVVFAQQPAGGRPAVPAGGQRNAATKPNVQVTSQPPSPRQPEWFPLAPADEKYLNDILKYWEYQTNQIQRYRCKFIQWEYEPTTLPNDPHVALTVAEGTIQYAAPDKGLFKVERIWDVVREQRQNSTFAVMKDGKPQMVMRVARPKEELVLPHWVCDGKSIYEFRAQSKQIVQTEIPPELQGSKISDGPLPFLFGAKAATIKERYWIHVIQPKEKKPGRYYLEAIPRRRDEAADFRAIQIVIDEQEFLPEAILLFHLDGSHDTYEFQNREKNWSTTLEGLNPFHQQFYAPKPPSGWKLVKEPFQPPAAAGIPTARSGLPAFAPRQAAQGSTMPQRR